MLIYLFTFLLAFSFALYLAPIVREAALKFGLVSRPDGNLRTQSEPVPYMGGIAIYLGFLLALAVASSFDRMVLGMLLAGTIMLLVGLIDDFGVMTPWMKLFGEIIAVAALLKAGIHIKVQFILDAEPWQGFPILSYLLSAFWLLGVTNAFNFLDIEDGLASGVAFLSCLSLFAVAMLNQNTVIATLTVALAGATLGFLRYGFMPAKIYLGDAGSLFLGLMLGSLAMIGSYTEKNPVALLAPVLILGVACFEIGFTMLARIIRGIPVMHGSPDHIAKRLQKAGLKKKTVVYLHYGASVVLGLVALAMMISSMRTAIVIAACVALAALALTAALLRIRVDWRPENG